MFTGSCVALVTPFKQDGVDYEKLKELVEFQIKGGIAAIVPCGTTGESATLSTAEHEEVIEFVVEAVKKRVPVIAGTGSNSTDETISLSRHAQEAGADGLLLVAPYYNKPTQKGLYLHFRKVAEEVKIPIILYNIPGRTGINVNPETIVALDKDCKNIVGVKEASGNCDQVSAIIQGAGEKFFVYSGDDALTLPILVLGGKGIISVIANILPGVMEDLCQSYFQGDLKNARHLHYQLFPLIKNLFIETNPGPVKTAMGLLGLCSAEMRLPLAPMLPENLEKLKKALAECSLIKEKKGAKIR